MGNNENKIKFINQTCKTYNIVLDNKLNTITYPMLEIDYEHVLYKMFSIPELSETELNLFIKNNKINFIVVVLTIDDIRNDQVIDYLLNMTLGTPHFDNTSRDGTNVQFMIINEKIDILTQINNFFADTFSIGYRSSGLNSVIHIIYDKLQKLNLKACVYPGDFYELCDSDNENEMYIRRLYANMCAWIKM
jgi:hypothetical protein